MKMSNQKWSYQPTLPGRATDRLELAKCEIQVFCHAINPIWGTEYSEFYGQIRLKVTIIKALKALEAWAS